MPLTESYIKGEEFENMYMPKEEAGASGFSQETLEAGLKDQPIKVRIVA